MSDHYDAEHWNWGKGFCERHRSNSLPCQACIDSGEATLTSAREEPKKEEAAGIEPWQIFSFQHYGVAEDSSYEQPKDRLINSLYRAWGKAYFQDTKRSALGNIQSSACDTRMLRLSTWTQGESADMMSSLPPHIQAFIVNEYHTQKNVRISVLVRAAYFTYALWIVDPRILPIDSFEIPSVNSLITWVAAERNKADAKGVSAADKQGPSDLGGETV